MVRSNHVQCVVLRDAFIPCDGTFTPSQPIQSSLTEKFGAEVIGPFCKWPQFGSSIVDVPRERWHDFCDHIKPAGWIVIPL